MSASQKKPWKKYLRRVKVEGGEGGERETRSRSDKIGALVGRLRRLEVAMLMVNGFLPGARDSEGQLDRLLQAMLDLHEDVPESQRSGGKDKGGTTVLPHEGTPFGEAEAEDDAFE